MKTNATYGNVHLTSVEDEVSRHAEEISVKGYTVVKNLYSHDQLSNWRKKIDEVYSLQEKEFGALALAAMKETDVCRAPLLYDFEFVDIAAHPVVLAIVKKFLGEWVILNLQNVVITRPDVPHHQSSWHRDMPYQDYVISKPLGINMLLAVDEFSPVTGGTNFVPFSHKMERLPSQEYIDNNLVVADVPAGSAIIFDCMLFHRAGANKSRITRRAVNHLYTAPIIKQQYDFPRAMAELSNIEEDIRRLLGFSSQVPTDDREWRLARARRFGLVIDQ